MVCYLWSSHVMLYFDFLRNLLSLARSLSLSLPSFLLVVGCLLSSSAAKHRAETNGQNLTDEWLRNAEIKRKKKLEDEERNARVNDFPVLFSFLTLVSPSCLSFFHFLFISRRFKQLCKKC
jgi:hypothetical protein